MITASKRLISIIKEKDRLSGALSISGREGAPACQKSPFRTFLTALSAEHFESVQNAVAESLDISSLSTAVYPI